MSKIENIDELRAQIKVLKSKAALQEQKVRDDIQIIREELKPSNLAWSMLTSITGISFKQGNPLRDGIFNGVSSFMKRLALRAEKELESRAYKVVDTIFDKLSSFVNGFAGPEARREERREEHDSNAESK